MEEKLVQAGKSREAKVWEGGREGGREEGRKEGGEMAEDYRFQTWLKIINVLFQILQLRRQAMQKEIKTMTGKK